MTNSIFHLQACSKSRGALEIMRERGVEAQVVDYVTHPPSVEELERLGRMLGVGALGMMRTGDALFTELHLSIDDRRTDREWFTIIREHPLLLQRPIVVVGERAVIARPSERVLEILADGP